MLLNLKQILLLSCLLCVAACTTGGRRGSSGSGDGTDGVTGFQGTDGGPGADSTDTGGTDATDGTDGIDGTSDSEGTDGGFPGISGFPSEELFLQIVGPGAEDHVTTGGSVTYVAGVLFGSAERITWSAGGGQTGEADGGRFWRTDPIELTPGDNVIEVTAVHGERTSTDRITITYNPGFFFAERPVARPSGFFTGSSVDVAVTIAMTTQNFLPGSVTLYEVDASGATVGQIGLMVDDGDTSKPSCDEIQDDGVFSRCATLQSESPTTRYLRVSLKVALSENETVTIYSPIVPIEIVDPITLEECQAVHKVQQDALALFEAEQQAGNPSPGQAVLEMLQADPNVVASGMNGNGHGIWAQFQGGLLGALNVWPSATRGGPEDGEPRYGSQSGALAGNTVEIQSKRVLAMAPFSAAFGNLDEVPKLSGLLDQQQCPEFEVDGPHQNGGTTLAHLRRAYEYGIVLYSGHADAYFTGLDDETKRGYGWEHMGSQEILWTGEQVACSSFTDDNETCTSSGDCPGTSECVITTGGASYPSGFCVDHTAIDLRRGRAVFGAETFGAHANLFPRYAARRWPSSLVYLGACRTLFSGTLAGALFGVGAQAVAGFTDYVSSTFAHDEAVDWFTDMLDERKTTGSATLFPHADPDNQTGLFALFGASNLLITESEIINDGFESGDITGWNVEGDGRVISQLGASIPVGGKFMGILSTGLGYTQQTGELSQSFCIPEGTQTVSLYWKFYSEEFLEYCGDIYQDTFQATLESGSGQLSLVNVTIDSLCPPSDCFGCGAQYVGLTASDVSFDQGDVYETQWQLLEANVAALAGKGPVTLRLFATDQGDSVFDTAILVDSITFD